MKLLEHQAKAQFRRAGLECPIGRLASSPSQAANAAKELGPVVVKAQVPIGGRGKLGGIKLAQTPDEARSAAKQILGMSIRGYTVSTVLCEEALVIARELYCGVALDRDRRCLVVMLSLAGGMEIEEVAQTSPEKIAKLWADPFSGPHPFEIRQLGLDALAAAAGDDDIPAPSFLSQLVPIVQRLYGLSQQLDAILCEVNPLVITTSGRLIAGDGKIEIDQNAEFRHHRLIKDLADEMGGLSSGEDPLEEEAKRRGLTYVHLGGDIGIIGNGAGLVMNTLDLVKQHGGEPANFLDIGGGAKAELVRNALEIVLSDPKVKGIFINIFGGITRGDEVANGVISARDQLGIKLPLVVRMTGTREEEGRKILEGAGIALAVSAPEAAQKIVELVASSGGGQ